MRSLRFASIALIGVLLVGGPSGCSAAKELIGAPKPKPPTREVVVLLDMSGSTKGMRTEFANAFQRLANTTSRGDRWIGYNIDRNSLINSASLFNVTVPSFESTSTNPMVRANHAASFEAEHPISGYQSAITSPTVQKIVTQISKGSDIFGGLRLAAREFSLARDDGKPADSKVLAIFSDMRDNSELVNTDAKGFDPKAAVAKIKAAGAIPDLRGVRVAIVGANDTDQARWARTEAFWLLLFKESGAIASADGYGRTLPDALLSELKPAPASK